MKDNRLISMTDFVLTQQEKYKSDRFYYAQFKDTVVNYATFLKQPLKLEMFVPCDEDGNVLEEPTEKDIEWFKNQFYGDFSERYTYVFNWVEAKEKVLFEGFEVLNSTTKNLDIINRNLGIIICFNSIISVMIEGANGYGGFSESEMLTEKLSQYNLELTPTALKQIQI